MYNINYSYYKSTSDNITANIFVTFHFTISTATYKNLTNTIISIL